MSEVVERGGVTFGADDAAAGAGAASPRRGASRRPCLASSALVETRSSSPHTRPPTPHILPPHPHLLPGVLTKLDIMDRGTDAAAALRGEVVPLRLGYVGVVLRSQEDIVRRRGMGEARAGERAFFESRPEYAVVAAQVCRGMQLLGWFVGMDAWMDGWMDG